MKKCCTCKKVKPDSEFAWRNKTTNRRTSRCKKCHAAYARTHYDKNRDTYIATAKLTKQKYRDHNRQMLLAYLQDKQCADCGENDIRVLEFDHKNPQEKEAAVSVLLQKRSWEAVLKEINKCEIRCANCHRKKTFTQFGFRIIGGRET